MIKHYSNSSTSTFLRCSYRFYEMYMMTDKGSPVEPVNEGVRLGRAGHLALKALYSGEKLEKAMEWAYEDFAPRDEQEIDVVNRLRSILEKYLEHTRKDDWSIEEVEKEVRIGKYIGIFDLVIRIGSQRYIVDHKFQKSNSTFDIKTASQASLYLLIAQASGMDVHGLLYNFISTVNGTPLRKIAFRSKSFLERYKLEMDTLIEIMEDFQMNPRPVRNFTRECKWDCPIWELCVEGMENQWQSGLEISR